MSDFIYVTILMAAILAFIHFSYRSLGSGDVGVAFARLYINDRVSVYPRSDQVDFSFDILADVADVFECELLLCSAKSITALWKGAASRAHLSVWAPSDSCTRIASRARWLR